MSVLIYSGNSWNGIWSHSHELAKNFAKKVKTIYFSVPICQDPSHPNLNEKANYPKSKNLSITSSKITFQDFSVPYMLYTQLYTITKFFSVKNKARTFFLYNTFDIPFFLLAKLFGKKVYFMYVDDYAALAKLKFFKILATIGTWIFLNFSDGVFCTARVLEEKAKKYHKIVYYTPNCVNLEDAKHLMEKSEQKFIIGFVGTLGHWVRIDNLIDVAREFKNAGDTEIWIVGGGEGLNKLKETKEKEALKNLKLVGFVPHEKVYTYMSQFDVALIPFYINDITNSVSPVKLFEYWLAKKPVICTKTKELAQFTGIALHANTSEKTIKYLYELKNNEQLREKYSRKGYELVIEKYNWDAMIKIYEDVI